MIKKISPSELKKGMYIQGFEGSWLEHPFWRTKFILEKDSDIELIQKSGVTILIDVEKGSDVEKKELTIVNKKEIEIETPRIIKVASSEEIVKATAIFKSAKVAVANMFKDARLGKAIDQNIAKQVSEEITNSVLRNSNVFVSLARLKTADDYSYMHSVAVCALMVALGKQLGLSKDECQSAGFAGLMHDLGKMDIPLEILNKPGNLTNREFQIIRDHPKKGYERLLSAGVTDKNVLDVCLHHHEKLDGTGYPDNLKDEEISLYARMGAICDIYDAVTSNRPYKAGWEPAESLKKMSSWTGNHLDAKIFQGFVKSIGIYPVGSLVLLSNLKLAVVIDQSETSLLKPIIKTIFSTKSNERLMPEIIDLSHSSCRISITSKEDPVKWNIGSINKYWAGDIS